MELYHGSKVEVKYLEIRKDRYTKDFSWGFYCTNSYEQAVRRANKSMTSGVVNVYEFAEDPNLKVIKFDSMNVEWLDFIAECRNGYVHDYDIVEVTMADDTIWNYVDAYLRGEIEKEVFFAYAKFQHPTHQISFHTLKALNCLSFVRSETTNVN